MKKNWKRYLVFVASGLVGIYVASYLLNTSLGGYWIIPERDGRDRYSFGLSMPTAVLWQPYIGYNARFNSDLIGTFYAPQVAVDRTIWHYTKYLTDQSTDTWLEHDIIASEIHPRFRAEFLAEKETQSRTSASSQ